MCLPYLPLTVDPCDLNSIGILNVDYIPRVDITAVPAEAVSPATIDQNGKLAGSFTLAAGKFWKKLPIESEMSNFKAESVGKNKSGIFNLLATIMIAQTSEKAIGTMNQIKYDDCVVVITATSGRKYVIGLGAGCGSVSISPTLDTQNTDSSSPAGYEVAIEAKSAKVYFLDPAVTILYA